MHEIGRGMGRRGRGGGERRRGRGREGRKRSWGGRGGWLAATIFPYQKQ
jgi:hypothetical protein